MANDKVRPVVIDCDPAVGIPGTDADDPLALLLAFGCEELEVKGITTVFGNCAVEVCARSALAVVEAAGRGTPVAQGMDRPLSGRLHPHLQEAYAGARGQPGHIPLPEVATASSQHAMDLIIELAAESAGELEVIATGPQTNIAMALLKEPRCAEWIKHMTFMGGALGLEPTYGRGNITPVAECNMWFDSEAADIVFQSGIPLTMVGLDVTNPAKDTVLYDDDLKGVDAAAYPIGGFFKIVVQSYIDAPMFELSGGRGCVLYDPVAVVRAVRPHLFRSAVMDVGIERLGALSRGQTVASAPTDDGTGMEVCVDVDGRAATEFALDRMLRA